MIYGASYFNFGGLELCLGGEACATRLCSPTFSVGLNLETSMALTSAAVGAFSAPEISAKESSHFHMHGSHF